MRCATNFDEVKILQLVIRTYIGVPGENARLVVGGPRKFPSVGRQVFERAKASPA